VTETRLPLERHTVIDLTRARAGPTAVRVLADWGANVIHVGPPDKPGAKGTRVTGSRDGFDYQNLNRNKRSITIDLSLPAGRELFMRLAARADVICENFRADVKTRLGIDYEAVSRVNPKIVYGSISGFGQTGPYARRPGLDQIAQGMGGLMSITGLPGQGPVRVGVAITDLCAGLMLAQGILLALIQREATGSGQWVHTSLLEAMTFMLDFQAARYLQTGEVAGQAGNDHPTGQPQSCYAAADKPVNIAATGDALFQRFCRAAGLERLIDCPDYKTDRLRSDNRARLNAEIAELVREKPANYWIELLNEAGVPCGPVNRIDELFAEPQMEHIDMVHHVDHPRLGRLEIVGQPVKLSAAPLPDTYRMPAPDPGQHTDEILRECGLDDAEIESLRSGGAI
jgi:formyl-CoA transferase